MKKTILVFITPLLAQALHWLKTYKFFNEAKRVMKPTGLIAIWYYKLPVITPAIDKVISKFYTKIVGKYWPPERQSVDDDYSSIPFPFKKLYSPAFKMTSRWSYEDLVGYLSTWSSVQRYKTEKGKNPINLISKDLLKEFGEVDNIFEVNWTINVWVGMNPA